MKNKNNNNQVALFQNQEVRRAWNNEQWWFVIEDVVGILTDSLNPKNYIRDIRRRDAELSKGWGQIAHTLWVDTEGGRQRMNCANTAGILRIIQSIPSKKAEPFKLWLAKVGKERLDEIQNPELAMDRMKLIYEKKGYPRDWIDKRVRGIAVRHSLTNEWQERGAKGSSEYAILTNEIMDATFDMDVDKYKKFKNLGKTHNLRDHMEDIELILTMLAEATTTKFHRDRDSRIFNDLKKDAREGGEVAGATRKNIEAKGGKKVVSRNNFLSLQKRRLGK